MFLVQSLIYWTMEDGYFYNYGKTQTIVLCTESFAKYDSVLLPDLVLKYSTHSTLKVRNKA